MTTARLQRQSRNPPNLYLDQMEIVCVVAAILRLAEDYAQFRSSWMFVVTVSLQLAQDPDAGRSLRKARARMTTARLQRQSRLPPNLYLDQMEIVCVVAAILRLAEDYAQFRSSWNCVYSHRQPAADSRLKTVQF